MKLLYEYPCQILPVLSLVSTERETGKTTFLNYIQMLFGENSTLINPSDLTSSFNDAYATKNIIMIDETVIEKQNVVEKLKSLATAKTISVSQKFVQHYSVPFFGKIIVCTNKETDFMRIDDEEIRFWIRKINPIVGKKNTNIENDLFNEIPKFLKYLEQLPEIDFSNSRMVFTQEEIQTNSLELIKNESRNGLRKEIEMYIEDFFNNNDVNEFEATAKDIKERWFSTNNQIPMSYILKVLKNEMKMTPQANKYYFLFNSNNYLEKKKGTPFLFVRQNEQTFENQSYSDYEKTVPY
jgi:phage/plasmid-associated DNA primase